MKMLTGVVVSAAMLFAVPAFAADTAKKPETPQSKPEQAKQAEGAKDQTATAELKDAQGKSVGTVTLTQSKSDGVIVHVKVHDLPEGEHAFHIHETGKCEAPFKTAGGHFNPEGHQHGVENPKGSHGGDLPNLHVPKSGELEAEFFTSAVTLSEGKTSVFDADGSAFVVHAKADDYASDPAGNAGDRIACGVIKK